MDEERPVHCHRERDVLTLTCEVDAFGRLARAVVVAADLDPEAAAGVETIVIRRATPPPPPTPWLDGLAVIGCVTIPTIILILLWVGAYAVSSWFW